MHTIKQLKSVWVFVLFFVVLTTAVCFAGPLIPGDFDENKIVSFGDLQILAQDWLSSSDIADMDDSGTVDFKDFSLFAANWQKCASVLVINEFMASNSNTIANPQGIFADWIEIYNTTDYPINIGGMYITDNLSNLTKHQIPTGFASQTTIPAHGFLLLWADNNSQAGPLHLDFALSASGEDIALVASDGVTIIDALTFGSQQPDISFGSYPNGSDQRRYFGAPTPGAANNEGYLGIVPTPVFSRDSGIFTDTFQLTISVDCNDAVIRYTTDHTIATETSTIYTGPITVSQTTEIMAKAFKPDFIPSHVNGKNFVRVSSEVANFNSNLPIIILDSFGYNIDAESSETIEYPYRNVYSVFIDTNDTGRATVKDEPDCQIRAGMRVRGQTSVYFPKKQYRFETWGYEDEDDEHVSIFGMPADSDWIIHGPYTDKTLIRNHLTYRLARDMGYYAVRTQLCEVFNNQNDGEVTYSDYAGVYVFMEKIKIGGERLQSEKLEPTDNAEPEISGGYVIKQDKGTTTTPIPNYFITSIYQKILQFDTPNVESITQAQKDWIRDYCNLTEQVLASPDFADPVNGYQKYIDPDSYINYFIIAEISRNVDGYILSDYMFKPRNGRIQRGPVWDYNYAWGNANYRNAWLIEGWQHIENSPPGGTGWGSGAISWLRRMFEDENFYLRCIDRWFYLRKNLLKADNIRDRIQGYADELEEAQQRNFVRWNILGVNISPNWFVGQTYEEEIDFLKDWVSERMLWIDDQFRKPPVFNQDGGDVDADFELAITQAEPPYVHKFIDQNDSWSYLDNGSNQGTLWSTINFTGHNSWPVANGKFGFGNGDENTIINYGPNPANKYITTYFRKYFTIDDLDMVQALTAKLLRDDGAVIWINGVEVIRDNIPGGRLSYTTLAASEVEGSDENTYYSHSIDPDWLLEGQNVLAVEVHLNSASSEDMGFDCALEGVIGYSTEPGILYYTTDGSDPRLDGGVVNPNAHIYTSPISFTGTTQIKARELDNGQWTALNEATFFVSLPEDDICITEWMYQGQPDSSYEFIEFTNVGTNSVNMTGWSFDDDHRTPGIFDLSNFGIVEPGESVIITEVTAENFRAMWGLSPSVKVIGNLGNPSGNGNNLGRADEINLYNSADELVDRLTYADNGAAGGPRTRYFSGNILFENLGQNTAPLAGLSYVGDMFGSYMSTGGNVGNPGSYYLYLSSVRWAVINGSGFSDSSFISGSREMMSSN